jgi:hypothetical protein
MTPHTFTTVEHVNYIKRCMELDFKRHFTHELQKPMLNAILDNVFIIPNIVLPHFL